MRAAIVGCGEIVYNKHLPGMREVPDLQVVGLCDTNLSRAREAAATCPGAKAFSDYREMIETLRPDAVHVCTPNRFHAEISIFAMRNGCHVLCEKPMATNWADAREMLRVSQETGRKLEIGHQNRYREDVEYLKRMCENGELGEIYYAKAFACNRRMIPSWGSFENRDLQGGGALIDIGCHPLDLALWLMDNYEPLYVCGQTFQKIIHEADPMTNGCGPWNKNMNVEESAVASVFMKNGAVLSIQTAWALNAIEKTGDNVVLCGSKAGADMYNSPNQRMGHMDGLRINMEHDGKLVTLNPNFYPTANEFFLDTRDYNYQHITAARQCRAFYRAIREDLPVRVKPEEACVTAMIIDGIYRSAAENRPVYFSEME